MKALIEDRQLKNWHGRERGMPPAERVLVEEGGERRGNSAITLDEAPVVSCQAQECANRPNRVGNGQSRTACTFW
jgi:hypothetical protein